MSADRIRPGSAARGKKAEQEEVVGAEAGEADLPVTPPSAEEVPEDGDLDLDGQGLVDDPVDGSSNDTVDGSSNATVDGSSNATVDGSSNATVDGTSNGNVDSASNGTAAGITDGTAGDAAPAVTSEAATTSTPLAEAPLAPAPAPATARRHRAFARIYYGETKIDFVRRRNLWFLISTIVILAGVVSLATRGLNLGIDFVGGTSWTVKSDTLTVPQVQSAINGSVSGATVTILGTGQQRQVEVQAKLPKGQSPTEAKKVSQDVTNELAKAAGTTADQVSVDSVGPSWGGQITHKAIEALIVFFFLIAIYISIFFEWRMALAAIIAVAHDILVTVGIYSLSGLEVTPDTVVAFLTILGYSLYDTIVVFDRVRDNARNLSVRDRLTYSDVVNLSMNQTLARSINTSLVAILPILSVLVIGAQILGASTLQYFGFALLVGLTTGAYSSIFIASPLVAILKEREPRYRQLRERLAQRGGDHVLLSAADVASGQLVEVGASRSATEDTVTPRPSRPVSTPANRRPASRGRPKGGRR